MESNLSINGATNQSKKHTGTALHPRTPKAPGSAFKSSFHSRARRRLTADSGRRWIARDGRSRIPATAAGIHQGAGHPSKWRCQRAIQRTTRPAQKIELIPRPIMMPLAGVNCGSRRSSARWSASTGRVGQNGMICADMTDCCQMIADTKVAFD